MENRKSFMEMSTVNALDVPVFFKLIDDCNANAVCIRFNQIAKCSAQ